MSHLNPLMRIIKLVWTYTPNFYIFFIEFNLVTIWPVVQFSKLSLNPCIFSTIQ